MKRTIAFCVAIVFALALASTSTQITAYADFIIGDSHSGSFSTKNIYLKSSYSFCGSYMDPNTGDPVNLGNYEVHTDNGTYYYVGRYLPQSLPYNICAAQVALTKIYAYHTYMNCDPGGVDGLFGALTEAAVYHFQTYESISSDGIVGPQTWYYLEVEANNR